MSHIIIRNLFLRPFCTRLCINCKTYFTSSDYSAKEQSYISTNFSDHRQRAIDKVAFGDFDDVFELDTYRNPIDK